MIEESMTLMYKGAIEWMIQDFGEGHFFENQFHLEKIGENWRRAKF